MERVIPHVRLVEDLFRGKTDWHGEPKTEHMFRVMLGAAKMGVNDWQAALYHDVVEDTDVTVMDLLLPPYGLSEETVGRIELLTHDPAHDYWRYIRKICESRDHEAILIKIADQMDNLDHRRRIGDPVRAEALRAKYEGVLPYLQQACLSALCGESNG